jgi:hypothetical protein
MKNVYKTLFLKTYILFEEIVVVLFSLKTHRADPNNTPCRSFIAKARAMHSHNPNKTALV